MVHKTWPTDSAGGLGIIRDRAKDSRRILGSKNGEKRKSNWVPFPFMPEVNYSGQRRQRIVPFLF
jgi:hypothetical protein